MFDTEVNLLELGITLSPEAARASRDAYVVLGLPREVAYVTHFDHVAVEFASGADARGEVRDDPRFLVHFSLLSGAESQTITCEPSHLPDASKMPHDFHIPGSSLDGTTCIPGRGVTALETGNAKADGLGHTALELGVALDYAWGDIAAFTPTFDQAKVVAGDALDETIGVPEQGERAILWPTRVSGRLDADSGSYRISLTDFVPVAP